ncbi:MAG: hypothetical protein IKL55_06145 [Clostridia bacterium]|nr:hypothetical protein [Clostridia bacterium]
MVISIVFAVLSVIVIVFTAIYLSRKKSIKTNVQKRKGKKNLKTLWDIDDIKNEVIISGSKNTIIMRIGSIDYHLLSEKEQSVLESNLIEIAKTIKYPLQFFSTTEFVDTTDVINDIKENIADKDNRKLIEYGNEMIKYLSNMMENKNLYVRKNYVLLSVTGNYEKSRLELLSTYESLRFNLLNAKIGLEVLNDYEIVELLHRELNKNTTTKIQDVLKEGGLELYVRGTNKSKKAKEK